VPGKEKIGHEGLVSSAVCGRDLLIAGPITGVLPRTTTALAPTTPRPPTTVDTMSGGSGGEAEHVLLFKRDSAGLYSKTDSPKALKTNPRPVTVSHLA
jgi:hypothetical protein